MEHIVNLDYQKSNMNPIFGLLIWLNPKMPINPACFLKPRSIDTAILKALNETGDCLIYMDTVINDIAALAPPGTGFAALNQGIV